MEKYIEYERITKLFIWKLSVECVILSESVCQYYNHNKINETERSRIILQ